MRRNSIFYEPPEEYDPLEDYDHNPPLNCPLCGTFTGGAVCNFYPCMEKRNYEDLIDKGFIDDTRLDDIPFYPEEKEDEV